jgi:hypothetical protein
MGTVVTSGKNRPVGAGKRTLRAVVDTLTVTGTGAELVKVCVDGWTEQMTVAGAPEQESVTVSLVPEEGDKVRL